MKPSPILLILSFALPLAYAGEFKVEEKPFKSTVGFEGSFLPNKALLMKVDPKVWTDFTIKELVEQGEPIQKGAPVVILDTEAIDRQLADDQDTASARKMWCAQPRRPPRALPPPLRRQLRPPQQKKTSTQGVRITKYAGSSNSKHFYC